MNDLTKLDMDDLDELDGLVDFDESGAVTQLGAPRNPADMIYPRTLPVELALRTASPQALREEYRISDEEWEALKVNPLFLKDLKAANDALREEGMSFRMKAQLQAEELLTTSWRMIHDKAITPTVRADLLKFTIRAAGLDGSKDQAQSQGNVAAMQININLGGA